MILYVEHSAKKYPVTQHVLALYPDAQVLYIDHYKNIFDKPNILPPWENAYILAAHRGSVISAAPENYEYSEPWYFFKTSLNCPFACRYCYLQGAFKSSIITIFVNYDNIMDQIHEQVSKHLWQKIIFYSSDYSDILALNMLTQFCQHFIPFFDTLDNVHMEIRTKSTEIKELLTMQPAKNTEICFSINPQTIIGDYELGTPKLSYRLQAAQQLIEAWWQVGLRIMPILPVPWYQELYTDLKKEIFQIIDQNKLSSMIIGSLLYTEKDYKRMCSVQPDLDILYRLHKSTDGFYRSPSEFQNDIQKIFGDIPNVRICLAGE